jgi:ERCC4-type nuclease
MSAEEAVVIDLLDDSDDEKDEVLSPYPAPHFQLQRQHETIDLCEDDDEDSSFGAVVTQTPAAARRFSLTKVGPSIVTTSQCKTLALQSNDTSPVAYKDYDSNEEDIMISQPVFEKRQAAVLSLRTSDREPKGNEAVPSLPKSDKVAPLHHEDKETSKTKKPGPVAVRSPYKTVAVTRQAFDDDIDSDSDLELIPGPAFAKPKPQSEMKEIVNPYKKLPPCSQESHDGDQCICNSERRTVRRPREEEDVVNPYKKSPTCSQEGRCQKPQASAPPAPDHALSQFLPKSSNLSSFQYPTLLDKSKQYQDERARFALALWRFGRSLTSQAHERTRLEQVMKKVVKLVLSEFPIRSIEEFVSMGRSSSFYSSKQQMEDFSHYLSQGGLARIPTPISRHGQGFYTIAEACLVALYERTRAKVARIGGLSVLAEKKSWMSLEQLIKAIDCRLRPECPSQMTRPNTPDGGVSFYLDPSTRSAEFLQITKLESNLDEDGPCIKRRKKEGKLCFELLPRGYHDAERIRNRSFPSSPGHYRCSKIREVDEKYKGICLGVDRQEGGGGSRVLHEMCGKLDMQKVPYFVGTLAIGDYVFFTSKDEGCRLDNLCPIIIERKSIQDVAQSINDGRWASQKARMYQGQFVFGYDNCKMVYIIEGNENKQLVTGGYIGTRWHNVDKERLQHELDNLKSEGFDVVRTPSRENTMFELARWAKRVAKEIREGTLRAEFTYQQFKDELRKIPPGTDFSRLAKAHAENIQTSSNTGEIDIVEVDGKPAARRLKNNQDDNRPAAKKPKIDTNDEFADCSTQKLKDLCKSVGLSTSGTKVDLIARYRGPHPPKLWLARKRRNQYVPERYNVAGAALLVALYLHEKKTGGLDKGLTKEELYVKAEELNVTKNPFSGGTTQTGPFHYDGWSSMKPLTKGDPALVVINKNRYKLTRSCDLAGFPVAEAMHRWCHQHNNCSCGEDVD